MSRYSEKYWDTIPIHVPMMDEPLWGCEITDNETGLIGSTNRGRSSKAKAHGDAWDDLMQKQEAYYSNIKETSEYRSKSYDYSGNSNDTNDLYGLLIKGVIYILIFVAIVWFVLAVAIPLIMINSALICLIFGLSKNKVRKFLFPLSIIGLVFLIADYNKGWFTVSLAKDVAFTAGLIPIFYYLNIVSGLVATYFLTRDVLNNQYPQATEEGVMTKRNLIIIGSLVIVGGAIIGTQKYVDSKTDHHALTQSIAAVAAVSDVQNTNSLNKNEQPVNLDEGKLADSESQSPKSSENEHVNVDIENNAKSVNEASVTAPAEVTAIEITIPFTEAKYATNSSFFRVRSVGEDIDKTVAENKARQNSNYEMTSNIKATIIKVADAYAKQQNINNSVSFMDQFEILASNVTNRLKESTKKVAVTTTVDNGRYTSWIVVETSRKSILDEINKSVLSNNELMQAYNRDVYESIFNAELSAIEKEMGN